MASSPKAWKRPVPQQRQCLIVWFVRSVRRAVVSGFVTCAQWKWGTLQWTTNYKYLSRWKGSRYLSSFSTLLLLLPLLRAILQRASQTHLYPQRLEPLASQAHLEHHAIHLVSTIQRSFASRCLLSTAAGRPLFRSWLLLGGNLLIESVKDFSGTQQQTLTTGRAKHRSRRRRKDTLPLADGRMVLAKCAGTMLMLTMRWRSTMGLYLVYHLPPIRPQSIQPTVAKRRARRSLAARASARVWRSRLVHRAKRGRRHCGETLRTARLIAMPAVSDIRSTASVALSAPTFLIRTRISTTSAASVGQTWWTASSAADRGSHAAVLRTSWAHHGNTSKENPEKAIIKWIISLSLSNSLSALYSFWYSMFVCAKNNIIIIWNASALIDRSPDNVPVLSMINVVVWTIKHLCLSYQCGVCLR